MDFGMERSVRSVWRAAFAVAVVASTGMPGIAHGQAVVRSARAPLEAPRGWIGVNLDATELHGPEGRIHSRLVIRGVVDGSPAFEAGLQPGDQILRLNGQPATIERFTRLARRLAPGDRFRVTLAREGREWDGWTREVVLEAAVKPASRLISVPGEMVVRLDSAMQRLDSLRVVISGTDRGTAPRTGHSGAIVGAGSTTTEIPLLEGLAQLMVLGPDSTRSVVLLGQVDRRTGWSTVSTEDGTTVWSSIAGDGATDVTDVAFRPGEVPGDSYRFLIRDSTEVGFDPGNVLGTRIRREADPVAPSVRPERVSVSGDAAPLPAVRAETSNTAVFRPLMPYIVGQNRVAGAELTPLNAELATYFRVERGLLVTDVSEGTPAAEAGLQPGDVVVRVGTLGVASLPDLRRALASPMPAEGLRLGLVRKGERVEVTLLR